VKTNSKKTRTATKEMKMEFDKLSIAFQKLEQAGYFARQNFWCCQNCGWAAVPDSHANKAVFYHQQDNEELVRLAKPIWLGVATADSSAKPSMLRASKPSGMATIAGASTSRWTETANQ
jgi:hypothetical protein